MSTSTVYLAIGVLVLLAVVAVALLLGRRPDSTPLTPLAGFAFSLVVLGMVLGENRVVGYSFFALGIAVSVADVVRRRRPRGPHGGHGPPAA